MSVRSFLLVLPLLGFASSLWVSSSEAQLSDDEWEIEVTAPSRELIFTNKSATHFACDTSAREMRSYAGLYSSMHESLDDYLLRYDGHQLEPSQATRVRVWPWLMRREYPGGWAEEVFLPLQEPVLLVRLEGPGAKRWSFTPYVDLRYIWNVPRPSYETQELEGVLCIRRKGWQPGPGAYAWLAVASDPAGHYVDDPRELSFHHPRDAARRAMGDTHPFQPGEIVGSWPKGRSQVDVSIAQGNSAEEAAALARLALKRHESWREERREWANELLTTAPTELPNARVERAYAWARVSMDELIMNVRGKGIYAGFHWFPNYWGRDTFISLAGATLDVGRLDDAREILRSFLGFQRTDRNDPFLGRLPNIVNPGQLQYEGVDGTWWHARASYRYIRARRGSGDPDEHYEREFAAALDLMIDGAERKAVDANGLLRHGDGETWMDAGGSSHPYSPRGDRAVEVQALYYNALRVAQWLAGEQGRSADATYFGNLAGRTAGAFRSLFWSQERQQLADHLNSNDSPDFQVRPNTILAVYAVEAEWPQLLTRSQLETVVNRAWERLVLPYGVTSLDPEDPAFKPRHLDLDHYYYDAAYHNGDVWYWLSGPMIHALCMVGRSDDALSMLDPLVDEVLDHGAVGAIREIRDGGNTGQKEEFGGATFQAWSMAEFIRAIHEDLVPSLENEREWGR
jgi:glycogen debranching enzyme